MPGATLHSPAEILAQWLIDRSLATLFSSGSTWPVYVSNEPDNPDNCITVFDTSPIKQGRLQINGEVQDRPGVQIRVRSSNFASGYVKMNSISTSLDTLLNYTTVTVSATSYTVYSFSRSSGPIYLGNTVETSKRNAWTLNGTLSLIQD